MEPTGQHESVLIDVSERTTLELMTSGDPSVKAALEHLLAAREQPRDVLLGWGNHLQPYREAADRMDERSDPAP